MTLTEFIDKLEADGEWCLDAALCIRRRDTACCPIEYVAGSPPLHVRPAGAMLGLTSYRVTNVIRASDRNGAPQLRARLLKACGLEEVG